MSIKVNADIIDLRIDHPQSTDVFFVDTNIWFWVGYTNASTSQVAKYNQTVDYPSYLNQALSVGSQLYKCTLSFAELAHSIERSEFEIFQKTPSGTNLTNKKSFRHDYPQQRQNVIAEINNTWALADAMTNGQTIEIIVDKVAISVAQNRLVTEALDGYDILMVDAVLAAKITQVITDDSDFGQVSGLTIFTANQLLLREAKAQGKLIKR